MNELHHFIKVEFHRFKAFEQFTLQLRHFNILVGPNNSVKSTILAAFRILAAAMRKAWFKGPELVPTPQGRGYQRERRDEIPEGIDELRSVLSSFAALRLGTTKD